MANASVTPSGTAISHTPFRSAREERGKLCHRPLSGYAYQLMTYNNSQPGPHHILCSGVPPDQRCRSPPVAQDGKNRPPAESSGCCARRHRPVVFAEIKAFTAARRVISPLKVCRSLESIKVTLGLMTGQARVSPPSSNWKMPPDVNKNLIKKDAPW